MDRLNQSNHTSEQGGFGEKQYINKPLQQPVKPVRPIRPGQNQGAKPVRPLQNQSQSLRQQQGNSLTQQRVNQAKQGQPKAIQGVLTNQQRVNQAKQGQPNSKQLDVKAKQGQPNSRQYGQNEQQRVNQVKQGQVNVKQYDKNLNIPKQEDNSSLAGKPKLTRLQREAQGIAPKSRVFEQTSGTSGNVPLQPQRDYNLSNTNAASFKVKNIKQEGVGFLILPLAIIVLMVVIIVIILGNTILSINDLKINTTSLLNSKPVSREEFIEAVNKKGIQVDNKELGGGITETTAYDEDYSYEINYITFESSTDAQAYYSYIIDSADETESSVSSSIVGQNSAESTMISSTYNGFMDITYIDNTIIIAIAYDSNKQTEIIGFMNSLGY